MKKTGLILSLLIFSLLPVVAQTVFIKGTIVNEKQDPLEFAQVLLKNGNRQIALAFTDNAGHFQIDSLQKGDYTMEVSLVGYNQSVSRIAAPSKDVQIILTEKARALKEVTVESPPRLIERKLDRIVFNLQNSIIAGSGSIWDAIVKIPGVRSDFGGTITANGKNVSVYIDDRLVRLSGEDLMNYLRGLSAGNTARIEVIPNPPARYDAQGGSIINIISKKNLTKGLSANLNSGYTQSYYSSYNGGLSLNYRADRWNLYGFLNYTHSHKSHTENEYVAFDGTTNYSLWENNKDGYRKGDSYTYRAGTDYDINKNNVIGFVIDAFNSKPERINRTLTDIYNNHNINIDSSKNTINNSFYSTNQYAYNLNYKGKLDSSNEKTLNIDLDYAPFKNDRTQFVNSSSYYPDGSLISDNYNLENKGFQNINILSGRIDFSQKLKNKSGADLGLKYSYISNDNNLLSYVQQNGLYIPDTSQSNNFNYSEKIMAGYINFRKNIKKLDFQIGLRGEYTKTLSSSSGTDQPNDYFKLFPTVFANYTVAKNKQFNIYYGLRIARPDYWRLNPFKYYSSPNTYIEGNPFLKPAYTNEFEFGYTYKNIYNVTAFYRRTTNYFSNITVQDNQNQIFYDTQQNLDKSIETGVHCSLPVTISSFLEMNYYIQATYKKEESGFLGGQYDYTTWHAYLNGNESFIISRDKKWKGEISGWYSSPSIQSIYNLKSTFDFSVGIRKTILKDKGIVRIAVADIFYGNYYRIDVRYLNQFNGFVERNDTRSITINFSYKFGKSKISPIRKRTTSDEDEKKRSGN